MKIFFYNKKYLSYEIHLLFLERIEDSFQEKRNCFSLLYFRIFRVVSLFSYQGCSRLTIRHFTASARIILSLIISVVNNFFNKIPLFLKNIIFPRKYHSIQQNIIFLNTSSAHPIINCYYSSLHLFTFIIYKDSQSVPVDTQRNS